MGDNFRLAKEIAQIAAKQQRVVTRAQLHAIGLDDAAIHRRVQAGLLYRCYRGVYSVGMPLVTLLEHASAAVLACGPGAALSHGSAMTLTGFWKRWGKPFEVAVQVDRRPRGIKVHRSAGLRRRDFRIIQGIRATSSARTLLDTAPGMSQKSLTRAINDGRRQGLVNLDQLADVVDRFPLHPGAPLLKPFVAATQAPTRSAFEDAFLKFCQRYGLPTPRMNARVAGYEVDALFVEERVIVELDSWKFHSDRSSFEGDRNRDVDTLLADLPTIRITDERFETQPEEEAARLHAILAQRRPRAA